MENPVDAASMFVQKASHMSEYLELKHYYGGEAEKRSVGKRIEFLKALKSRSQEKEVVAECDHCWPIDAILDRSLPDCPA